MALGALAVFPLYFGSAAAVLGRSEWASLGIETGVVCAVLIGCPLGYYGWYLTHGNLN